MSVVLIRIGGRLLLDFGVNFFVEDFLKFSSSSISLGSSMILLRLYDCFGSWASIDLLENLFLVFDI